MKKPNLLRCSRRSLGQRTSEYASLGRLVAPVLDGAFLGRREACRDYGSRPRILGFLIRLLRFENFQQSVRVFKVVFIALLFLSIPARSSAEPAGLVFSKNDRVLIVAPHPDDEALGTGGLIQAALSAGAQVRVAYLTNGEFNEISSISYQIKPLLIKSDFLKNGRTRKAEAITAMSFFGLRREDLFFFGYPDSGTIKIWQRYWNGVKPFRGFFTRINKVLDPDDVSYGSYYRGESVVRDFEKVLLAFRPTHIFVTAPFDINFDHQASYLYLNVALLDLKDRLDPFPSTHLYIIHARNWPRPKSLAPGQPLTPPDAVKGLKTLPWKTFPLSEDQINRKREVVLRYKTQIAYSKNFLLAFVRSNELYLDMAYEPVAAREENPRAEAAEEKIASERDVKYKIIGKDIFIDIPLQTRMEEMGVLTTDLFGYRKGLPFEQMPKLSLRFFGNRLFIKDGSRSVSDQRVRYKIEEKRVLVQIPFQVLRSPDYLFVSTRTAKDVILPGFGAWRILELPKKLRV